jgi:hypothetical protein
MIGSVILRNERGEKVVVKINGGEVMEEKRYRNGRYYYWIKYGNFEKARTNGDYLYIKRYRKKTSRGLHALQVRKDKLLYGHKGTCYTYYSRGKFLWQKFIYHNGRCAYFVRWTHTEVKAVYPDGKDMFEIKVNSLYTKGNTECEPFVDYTPTYRYTTTPPHCYSVDGLYSEYTCWDRRGRVKDYYKFEKRQKVGEWVRDYKTYFYLSGLEVPKKMYNAKPEDIDPKAVLRERNAQVRAMLIDKIGLDRIVKKCKGKVIHKTQGYQLIDFKVRYDKHDHLGDRPDKVLRVLSCPCPSTKSKYFLNIPPTDDFKTCLKARNGTFTSFEPNAKEVVFDKET